MSNDDDTGPGLTWKHVVLVLGIFLITAGCEVTRYKYGASIW